MKMKLTKEVIDAPVATPEQMRAARLEAVEVSGRGWTVAAILGSRRGKDRQVLRAADHGLKEGSMGSLDPETWKPISDAYTMHQAKIVADYLRKEWMP